VSEARPPSSVASLPGEPSRVFRGLVGRTYAAADWLMEDLLIDRERFDSEGNWAFCRFDSDEVPAVRMGFQAGSFAIGPHPQEPDPDLLQLHLEVMTADGAWLWLPTGTLPATRLDMDGRRMDVRLPGDDRDLLRIRGWPLMEWHGRTPDDELEVRLQVDVRSVTVLPDCLLPQSVFAMWETMGRARGSVRVDGRRFEVEGHAFFDHTRVVHRPHPVTPRRMYLYPTLAFEDGSGVFGYHAEDADGRPLAYYCFGVHVDRDGRGTFLPDARVTDLALDADGLPERWRLDWRSDEVTVEAEVSVRPLGIARAWGAPTAPRRRADYVILPLVLDARATIRRGGSAERLAGTGLAEYYDAVAWGS
jgi:hypothetical protein